MVVNCDIIKSAFVKPFKTLRNYYLYDVNTNSIISVIKEIHDAFNHGTSLDEKYLAIVNKLFADGFLRSNPIKEIVHPCNFILCNFLDRKIQGITLQVTQECNLRCKYCVYSGGYNNRSHSNKKMSFDLAKKAIDFLIQRSIDLNDVNISFYGGEPIINFDLIKEIVAYVESRAKGKNVVYNLTTNGTIFTDEILKFFSDNNFGILISLDGPKEIQDANRVFADSGEGTFDKIMENLAYIKENYSEFYKKISFNAVIDPSLDFSCYNNFFISSKDFEPTRVMTSVIGEDYKKKPTLFHDQYFIQRKKDMFKLYMNKIGRIEKEYVSPLVEREFLEFSSMMHQSRYKSSNLPEKFHPGGPCIPGARKLFIDINGNLYPCERVSESSVESKIGSLETGFDLDQVSKLLNIAKITEDECKNCWGSRFCRQCFATSDDNKGLSKHKRLSSCVPDLAYTEKRLKDYCMLLELGCSFENINSSIFKNLEEVF